MAASDMDVPSKSVKPWDSLGGGKLVDSGQAGGERFSCDQNVS